MNDVHVGVPRILRLFQLQIDANRDVDTIFKDVEVILDRILK